MLRIRDAFLWCRHHGRFTGPPRSPIEGRVMDDGFRNNASHLWSRCDWHHHLSSLLSAVHKVIHSAKIFRLFHAGPYGDGVPLWQSSTRLRWDQDIDPAPSEPALIRGPANHLIDMPAMVGAASFTPYRLHAMKSFVSSLLSLHRGSVAWGRDKASL